MRKKGQLNFLQTGLLGLFFVAILIVIGGIIVGNLKQDVTASETVAQANLTITVINGTNQSLGNYPVSTSPALLLYNATSPQLIIGNSYILDNVTGIINITNTSWDGQDVIAVFSVIQDQRTASYNATQSSEQGLENISGQLPLLGTVIVFAAIIGLVLSFNLFRKGPNRI